MPSSDKMAVFLNPLPTRFDSPASSARARTQLDGADIYAGCCTLKIEFARVSYSPLTVSLIITVIETNFDGFNLLFFIFPDTETECL